VLPRHARGHQRNVEGEHDEHDEGDRASVDPPVVAPQGPRTGLELVPLPQPQVHGDDVREVQADRADRGDREVGPGDADLVAPVGRDRDEQRGDRHGDDCVERHTGLVEAPEEPPARHPTVARERVPRARRAGQARRAAEELADRRDDEHQLGAPDVVVHGTREDRDRGPAGGVDGLGVAGRKQEREQHDPAEDRRVEHRLPHALGRTDRCIAGLLGGVGGRVVASLRVHRQDEADGEHVEPEERAAGRPEVEARVVDLVAEDEPGALVMVRDEGEDSDDREHAQHVPPDRDVVEEAQQTVGEDVHDGVEDENEEEQHEGVMKNGGGVAGGEVDAPHLQPVETEQCIEEDRRAVADPGDDADETDHVEPAGEPTPAFAPERGRPPVGAARGRVGGGQLSHRERDQQDECAEDWPADRDCRGPAGGPCKGEVREAAGEDRDDRERDREVGEAAPGACELLLVAELSEALLVVTTVRMNLCHRLLLVPRGWAAASLSQSAAPSQPVWAWTLTGPPDASTDLAHS
jgi:hypothetical protein